MQQCSLAGISKTNVTSCPADEHLFKEVGIGIVLHSEVILNKMEEEKPRRPRHSVANQLELTQLRNNRWDSIEPRWRISPTW